jgi:hypothetical protein
MAIYHKDIIKFTYSFLSSIPTNHTILFLNIYEKTDNHNVDMQFFNDDYLEYQESIKTRKFCRHYIFEITIVDMDSNIAGTEQGFLQEWFDWIVYTNNNGKYFCCLTIFDNVEHRNQYKNAGFKMKYFKKANKPDEKDKKKELIVI